MQPDRKHLSEEKRTPPVFQAASASQNSADEKQDVASDAMRTRNIGHVSVLYQLFLFIIKETFEKGKGFIGQRHMKTHRIGHFSRKIRRIPVEALPIRTWCDTMYRR